MREQLIIRKPSCGEVGCFGLVIVVFLAVLLGNLPLIQEIRLSQAREGILVKRRSPDLVTLRPSTIREFSIDPESTLWRFKYRVEALEHDYLKPAVVDDNYWSVPLGPGYEGVRFFWVNAKLDDAIEMIYAMWDSGDASPEELKNIYRIAGAGYVYLGYAVRNIEDVRALARAMRTDPDFDSSEDVTIDGRTIYRFRPGVVEQIAENPEDEAELQRIRSEIPVVVERANGALGHPMDTVHVLYLDGSIEELPFGSEFPATQAFLEALFNSAQSNPASR